MRKFKNILAAILVLAMVLSLLPSAFAAEKRKNAVAEPEKTEKSEFTVMNGKSSLGSELKLNNFYQYDDDQIVRAIVLLEDAPVADAADRGTTKAASYRVKVINGQNTVLRAMNGIRYDLKYRYDTLLNGFCCDVAYGDLAAIAAIDGVKSVHIANHYDLPVVDEVPATRMPSVNGMVGNNFMWELGFHGEGTVIAVLDTGLLTTHEAFQDQGGICAKSARLTEADLQNVDTEGKYMSAKVPFAYDYADGDQDVTDCQGHGTHVSGICAGWVGEVNEAEGSVTSNFCGVAPAAQILSMKIFHDDENQPGTDSGIYFQALEDAYKLGADVINMSIGAQNGFTYDAELEDEVFGNIYKRISDAGVILSVAGGNEFTMAKNSSLGYIGPDYMDYGTIGSPASYEGANSVASFENPDFMSYVITVDGTSMSYVDSAENPADKWLDNFGGKTLDFEVIMNGEGTDIAIGAESDYYNMDLTGKVAVVSRGTTTFEEKVELAADAGAIGCIVLNNEPGKMGMSIEDYEVPAVCMDQSAREVFMKSSTHKLTVTNTLTSIENPMKGQMSDFSNWGPTPMLTIDPAITGIGGQVYSSVCTGDNAYEVYSGTSMATPNLSGIYALMTNVVNYLYPEMEKAERAKLVEDVIESSAQILGDDQRIFSVREQGAGLASAVLATDAILLGSYIADPLKELGDDPEKTGVYEYDVTLKNLNKEAVTYSEIVTCVMTDVIANLGNDDNPIMGNTLMQAGLGEDDCTITYTVDGKEVTGVTVPANGEVTVHVNIRLSELMKAYFDETCPNGTYVEGFTEFYKLDEDGKTVTSAAHATFLSFYGDWLKAPVMQDADFMDFLDAAYFLTTDEAAPYIEMGVNNPLMLLDTYTMPNLAFTCTMPGDPMTEMPAIAFVLGENAMGNVPGNELHPAFSTGAREDPYGAHCDGIVAIPYLLRNVRNLVMTISDKETGEVYYVDNTEYLPKAAFDETGGSWQSYGTFMWDGKDLEGNYVPNGTVVTVNYDAKLPYDDTTDPEDGVACTQKNVWSFDVAVDYQAPEMTTSFDEKTRILTVTAKDDQFLQGVYLTDGMSILDSVPVIQKEAGEEVTLTFDLTDLFGAYDVYVSAIDYGTNETMEEVVLYGEDGKDATITLVAPDGTKTYNTKIGEYFTFPSCDAEFDRFEFGSWGFTKGGFIPVEEYMASNSFAEGQEALVTCDATLYATYARLGETDIPSYSLVDTIGTEDLAIVGLPIDETTFTENIDTPIALGKNGSGVDVIALQKAFNSPYYLRFYSEAHDIRFIPEENNGVYTFKNAKTEKYLAAVDGEIAMVDVVTPKAQWTVVESNHLTGLSNVQLFNVENPDLLFAYDTLESKFALMDSTKPYVEGGTYYPGDLFHLYAYEYAENAEDADYLTTNPVKFTDADAADWFIDAVDYMAASGLMGGVGTELFGPEETLTRAMMVTVLYRAAGSPEVKEPCTFKDVEKDQWFSDAIAWAEDKGIVNGVDGEGHFAPDDNVTREDIAVILWRAMDEVKVNADMSRFQDTDKIMDYAKDAMAWAVDAGILNGDNGNLKPLDFATRAEFAAMFMRFLLG